MAATKSTASTTISSGNFVKIDGKGIALVKQQVCRDGAVMYIVHVCGCDFDVEIDAKRVQTVTADSDSETKQTTGSSSRFKIVTDQEVNDFNIKQTNKNTLTKTISDLRIFQAFCNEPEIVIVPVSRKCTKTRRWWHVLVGPNLWPLFAKSSLFNMLPKCFGTFSYCSWGTLLHIVENYVY